MKIDNGLQVTDLSRIKLSGAARTQFLLERFTALSPAEQSMALSWLLSKGDNTSPLPVAVSLVEHSSDNLRLGQFESLLKDGNRLDDVTRSILYQNKQYFPALLAALNAAYAGDDLGILTARGNRRGHGSLLTAINSFLGVQIPRKNTYFVNDSARNGRLGVKSTAEKKLHILRDFATGTYIDEEGQQKNLSKQYERVLFYDDEGKNLTTVSSYAAGNDLSTVLFAIDARELDPKSLWEELLRKVDAGFVPNIGQSNVIHFFDIDGTLIKLDASIYVVHAHSGDRILTISQEEFAEEPVADVWFQRAMNGIHASSDLSLDFSDFADANRINSQLAERTEGNRLFRRL